MFFFSSSEILEWRVLKKHITGHLKCIKIVRLYEFEGPVLCDSLLVLSVFIPNSCTLLKHSYHKKMCMLQNIWESNIKKILVLWNVDENNICFNFHTSKCLRKKHLFVFKYYKMMETRRLSLGRIQTFSTAWNVALDTKNIDRRRVILTSCRWIIFRSWSWAIFCWILSIFSPNFWRVFFRIIHHYFETNNNFEILMLQ